MTSELRTKNITYDDRDTNNLKYGLSWFHDGIWNASNLNMDQIGTLSGSNDPNAYVTFNFPIPAIAFHYFGILRSRGGLYGICVDCDPNQPNLQDIDAFNITDDGQNPPVALFSKHFDTPAQHVVILKNKKDPRGVPAGNSQITIDRFVLEVVDDSPTPVTTQAPSPTPTNVLGKAGPPVGAIVGGAIGGLLLAVILIISGLHYMRRYKRHQLAFAHENLDAREASQASIPIIVPYTSTHPSLSKEERPKAGRSRRTYRPPGPTPSSGSTTIVTDVRFRRRGRQHEVDAERRPKRRREVDAGPIPPEHEESIPPPLYEQAFRAGPSNSPPSDQEPDGQSQPISFVVQNVAK
ncbi:hypothetical protein AAF712_011659 [Marasmius tenuissimus]|uniref:Uncharacterized protein n=1 Tax=Marasmius tenuissimus TaxID=585030 RepID=A0ABR2ZKI0_9AGAR